MATGLEVVSVRENKREKIFTVGTKKGYINEFFSDVLNRELGIKKQKKDMTFYQNKG